eukprot:Sspe_Gene.34963::Locus_16974_Transcript_1_1_Confidence_1.000_Length_2388::g.34963::m.34963/K03686/dnaJ; molecular chaperone DnaJ
MPLHLRYPIPSSHHSMLLLPTNHVLLSAFRATAPKTQARLFQVSTRLLVRSHYDTLGIHRKASASEVKKAYREKAKKYHPDMNKGATTEDFGKITEAYNVLNDPQKRQAYDMSLGQGGASTAAGANAGFNPYQHWNKMEFQFTGSQQDPNMGPELGKMWEDIFGSAGTKTKPTKHTAQKGGDITLKLKLSFLEAVEGCTKEVSYQYLRRCTPCKGTGSKDGAHRVRCTMCHGRGKQQTSNGFYHIEQPCSACGGSGEIVRSLCTSCGGSGTTKDRTTQQITVPAGVNTLDRLRIPNKGEAGTRGGQNGHLFIDVYVEDHHIFTRDGEDVHVVLPITVTQAALGGKVSLPTLSGDVTLTVSPGTQQGEKVVLRGKGIRKPNRNTVGDQYVHFHIMIPRNLSPKQRAALELLAAEEDKAPPSQQTFRALKEKYKKWIDFKEAR